MKLKLIVLVLMMSALGSCAPKVLCPAYTLENPQEIKMQEKI